MRGFFERLRSWHVAIAFIAIGLIVFFPGLTGEFQNDDSYQIVNSQPVHSLYNLPVFFQSSTFYNGEKLTGVYYRPMMTTTFSLIYSFFGANPIAFHVVQLTIYIASAFIIFLIFRRLTKNQAVAIIAGLVFLVHPLNSQVVYSIPTMQDALFFFFGSLALWNLIANKHRRVMLLTALLLFLTLLSKESGLLFVVLCATYLALFDRKRLLTYCKYIVVPVALYVLMRINAVGFGGAHSAAPINELELWERLLTAPSVLLFYISKFLFPAELSLGYYWVEASFSIRDVLIPLLVDILVLGILVYFGWRIKKRLTKHKLTLYLFFAIWTVLGMGLYLQILPGLDFTACETWSYFAMAGLLGMLAVAAESFIGKAKPLVITIVLILVGAVIIALGVRSHIRGYDYVNQYALALGDIAVSPDNYAALNNISQEMLHQSKYQEAADYAKKSIDIYPIVSNYINLGVANQHLGNYKHALDAYNTALKYGNINIIYQNMALVHFVHSDNQTTAAFFEKAITEYPRDFRILLYYAIFEQHIGNNEKAVSLLSQAMQRGQVPQIIYTGITYNQVFVIPILDKTITIGA